MDLGTTQAFKDFYESEIDHKFKLHQVDSLLVAALLVLSGVVLYYAKILPETFDDWISVTFGVLATTFVATFVVTIACVVASIWPRPLSLISSPEDFQVFVEGLERFHAYYHKDNASESNRRVGQDFSMELRRQFVQAGQINRDHVVRKSASQAWARYFMIAAVLFMVGNAIPTYVIDRRDREMQKQSVGQPSQNQITTINSEQRNDGQYTSEPSDSTITTSGAPSHTSDAKGTESPAAPSSPADNRLP